MPVSTVSQLATASVNLVMWHSTFKVWSWGQCARAFNGPVHVTWNKEILTEKTFDNKLKTISYGEWNKICQILGLRKSSAICRMYVPWLIWRTTIQKCIKPQTAAWKSSRQNKDHNTSLLSCGFKRTYFCFRLFHCLSLPASDISRWTKLCLIEMVHTSESIIWLSCTEFYSSLTNCNKVSWSYAL